MMVWSNVGNWLKDNAGKGAALVGSLVTGNIPGAVAAGISMVSSATGTNDPKQALKELQGNPDVVLKLQEIAAKKEEDIRKHVEAMERLKLEDRQAEQAETQKTIRSGDTANDKFVRRTRPGQSWLSLAAAIAYAFTATKPDSVILGLLLTLPFTYAGLRGFDKGSFGTIFKK